MDTNTTRNIDIVSAINKLGLFCSVKQLYFNMQIKVSMAKREKWEGK